MPRRSLYPSCCFLPSSLCVSPFFPENSRRPPSQELAANAGEKPGDRVPLVLCRRPCQATKDGDLISLGAATIADFFSPEPLHDFFDSGQHRAATATPLPPSDSR